MTNNIIPIRIAVTGVTGRMGKEITQCIIQNKLSGFNEKIILGAAITRPQSTCCGVDIGTFIKSNDQKIIITDDIESVKKDFDILIDFSNPNITAEYLKFCVIHKKNMIIGTTGLNQDHYNLMQSASKTIGIVYSANFSIGITIMLQLLAKVAKTIGNIVDIDIIESHHNEKIDIPSGTALMIRSIIKSNINKNNIFSTMAHNKISHDKCTSKKLNSSFSNKIKIHSIRSSDIVGTHTVIFGDIGECLEITHKASNRKIFANGALIAACWLGKNKTGLFNLNDVFCFKK